MLNYQRVPSWCFFEFPHGSPWLWLQDASGMSWRMGSFGILKGWVWKLQGPPLRFSTSQTLTLHLECTKHWMPIPTEFQQALRFKAHMDLACSGLLPSCHLHFPDAFKHSNPKNQGDPSPGSVAPLWVASHRASAGGQHRAVAKGLGGTGTDLWRTSLCEGHFQLWLRVKGQLRKASENWKRMRR